jgi:hypothetical protein
MGYFIRFTKLMEFSKIRLKWLHPFTVILGAEASPGDLRFVDINGDGLINSSDRTNIESLKLVSIYK